MKKSRGRQDIEKGTYHFLDMGNTQYGECIVAIFDTKKILIDAGHRGDLKGQQGFRSIPEQLQKVLGEPKPHFDLLVVTHCHDDHIGCMPELVSEGIVSADWALVSDEKWGYGRGSGADSDADFGLDDANDAVRGIVAALCEEDHSDLTDASLTAFIDAAATVEDRYSQMLEQLHDNGTKIIRWQRDELPDDFNSTFASLGLNVLGPSKEQLEACNNVLAGFIKRATRTVRARVQDAPISPSTVYRDILSTLDAADMAGTSGPAKNNQSIVLAFGPPGQRVLLGADMQLAKSELPTANDSMTALRDVVAASGPYIFVKALHHTSYNGLDDDVLSSWGNPQFILHSGGRNDKNHPDKTALATLKRHRSELKYARTDRNGIIAFTSESGFVIEGGRLNDFSANAASDTPEPFVGAIQAPEKAQPEKHIPTAPPPSGQSILVVRIPYGSAKITIDGVVIEVETDRPTRVSTSARQTQTAASQPEVSAAGGSDKVAKSAPQVGLKFADGRTLADLLFVTQEDRLRENIGQQEASRCLKAIEDSKNSLLRLTAEQDAISAVTQYLIGHKSIKGVVLLGGFDVVPSQRVDVLTPDLRERLGTQTFSDGDNFIVWSDDAYGDTTGVGMPDLPVSRIPDGRDSILVFRALSAGEGSGGNRFGIRNINRDFATAVWDRIPGNNKLNISVPFVSSSVKGSELLQQYVYFMLHGSSTDGRVFCGEAQRNADADESGNDAAVQDAAQVETFLAKQVPAELKGTVMAGCCWGALTVKDLAADTSSAVPAPRVPEASIALSFLKAGAMAYVGCTGSHYSPNSSGGYAGGPMHHAFWSNVCQQKLPPAKALWLAKVQFLKGLPFGRTDLYDLAILRKILREFTCLGLGW